MAQETGEKRERQKIKVELPQGYNSAATSSAKCSVWSLLSCIWCAHLQRSALHWAGGGGQGCGRWNSSDNAGVMLQSGQQQRLGLDKLGLQQHLREHTHKYTCTIKIYSSIMHKQGAQCIYLIYLSPFHSGASWTHLQVLAARGMWWFGLVGLLWWSEEGRSLSAPAAESELSPAEHLEVMMTSWWQFGSHCRDCQLK